MRLANTPFRLRDEPERHRCECERCEACQRQRKHRPIDPGSAKAPGSEYGDSEGKSESANDSAREYERKAAVEIHGP